jgi:hypothetical protein
LLAVAKAHDSLELRYGPIDAHALVRIAVAAKRRSALRVVDGEMTGLDVYFSDGLAVDGHLQAFLWWRHLLIAAADAVQSSALLPRAVVEIAGVALMLAATDFAVG